MINIEFPLFKIPATIKVNFKKPGGGSEPKFFGDKKKFEETKRQRLGEVDSMLNIAQRKPGHPSNKFFNATKEEQELHKIYKYRTPTLGNAGYALSILLEFAKQNPEGVWGGD